jgi:serine-type D-Ala-D-Ala carboxypeptidase (penicillin-binding protein 5/6)
MLTCDLRGMTRSARRLMGGAIVAVAVVTCVAVQPSFATSSPAAGAAGAALAAQARGVAAPVAGPDVSVRGADLVDVGTGAQLWAKDVSTERPMGSITKVMTALLVLRAGDLNRKIRVTEAAVRYVSKRQASSAGLIVGDVLTARQLLAAMLIPSGCDAAYLLATAYGPGRTAFIAKMNAAAKAMGMTSTHFSSFDGMPYPTEYSTYSTPADLIVLGEHAMRWRVFRQIVDQKEYYVPATASHHSYTWYQTNGLIGSYQGILGIKTGETDAAGDCLLFEARRDGVTLIGVVLHANPSSVPTSAITAGARVLNWGFAHA